MIWSEKVRCSSKIKPRLRAEWVVVREQSCILQSCCLSDVVMRGMSSIMLAADRVRTTVAGQTEVVGQRARCSAIQALVNQCRQLESDSLSHRQPIKWLENRHNVVGAPGSSHQTRSCVLDWLQSLQLAIFNAVQQGIAVVACIVCTLAGVKQPHRWEWENQRPTSRFYAGCPSCHNQIYPGLGPTHNVLETCQYTAGLDLSTDELNCEIMSYQAMCRKRIIF